MTTTRRAVLSATPAAVIAAAVPATATVTEDDPVFSLIAEHCAAIDHKERLSAALDVREDQVPPELSSASVWVGLDYRYPSAHPLRELFTSQQVQDAFGLNTLGFAGDVTGFPAAQRELAERQAAMKACQADLEAIRQRREELRHSLGITVLNERWEKACDAVGDLEDRLLMVSPTTFAGAQAYARHFVRIIQDDASFDVKTCHHVIAALAGMPGLPFEGSPSGGHSVQAEPLQ